MSESPFDQADPEVTRDLAHKTGVDIIDLVQRTLDIAPPGKLPIIGAAAVASIGFMVEYIKNNVGVDNSEISQDKLTFVAALITARMMKHKSFVTAMEQAMIDVDVLVDTGRL